MSTLNERFQILTPIVDLRHKQSNPPVVQKKHKLFGRKVVERKPEDVIGIGLHQMGVVFGVSARQIKQAGSPEAAKDLRALGVAAHVCVWLYEPGEPRIVIANPLRWYVNHGNGLNDFTIGLEVEGKYPDLPKDGGYGGLSKTQVGAIRDALLLIVLLAKEEGMDITKLWGHRQSHGGKPSDPGAGMWRAGVRDYARPVLGLLTPRYQTFKASNAKSKDGLPIPASWER